MSLGFGGFRLWTIDAHKGGEGVRSEEIIHKNAIKHKTRFSDNLKSSSKEFGQHPKDPLGFPTTVYLCFRLYSF